MFINLAFGRKSFRSKMVSLKILLNICKIICGNPHFTKLINLFIRCFETILKKLDKDNVF